MTKKEWLEASVELNIRCNTCIFWKKDERFPHFGKCSFDRGTTTLKNDKFFCINHTSEGVIEEIRHRIGEQNVV